MRRRKLMLPPFHGERMRAYESVIEEATQRQMESWPSGERFPLHPSMQALTLEVILRAVFGVEDDGRRDELSEHLVAILATTQSPRAVGLAIPRLRKLPPWRNTVARIERTDELLVEEIARRRSDPALAEREDILSMLVAARFDDGSAMGDRDIRDQLMTLLLAGHETTATSLAWAFDQLFHRPDAMERLREEVAGDETQWLDAVITESMRLRPVVPFTGRQLREPAARRARPARRRCGDGRHLSHPHARRRLSGRPRVPARAVPGRRARDVLLGAVRRRHPPLPGSLVRADGDARRDADHSARCRAESRRRPAGARSSGATSPSRRRREPARSSSAVSSYSSPSRRASTSGTCSR